MTNRREWPTRLRMARVDDSEDWYASVNGLPPQDDDRVYVLNELVPIVKAALEQINAVYPPDIFTGVSGDEGVFTVVAVRDGLTEMVQWYADETETETAP